MANEFSPELNDQVYQAILRKIQEEEAHRVASARGEAITRGMEGSTYEAARIGAAQRASTQSSADALTQLAIENATRQREERMIKERETYDSGESEKQRTFQGGQADIERQFQGDQAALGRQFQGGQADQQRAFEEAQARREARQGLLNQGLGSLASVGGQLGSMALYGHMFGGAAAGGAGGGGMLGLGSGGGLGLTGSAGMPVGSTLGGAGAGAGGGVGLGTVGLGALGYGAGALAGSGAGQLLGKGLFKSDAARTGARKGAQIGSVLGTGALGPVGGLIGGTAGSVIGGAAKKVGKVVSKAFCFDPGTPVEMADGTVKPISQIALGEETKGGKVVSIRTSLTEDGTVCRYQGVTVTGSHAVKENGRWIRVEKSMWAIPVEGAQTVVSLVTNDHRIFVDGIEFADEYETPFYEILTMEQSLAHLNGLERLKKLISEKTVIEHGA